MAKRKVEVFTAGCPLCDEAVKLVKELACPNCDVRVYSMQDETGEAQERATQYGIYRVPAVVVDGKLVDCCQNQKPVSRKALIAAGVGQE